MGTAFAVAANNVTCIVGPGGYTAGSGTLTVAAGQGSKFPALTGDQFYRITVVNAAYAFSPAVTTDNLTIFRASSLVTDTFGSVLAIEGTTDRNYSAGDSVGVNVTAGTISDIQTQILNMQNCGIANQAASIDITTTAVWTNTGLSAALPATGVYLATFSARINLYATSTPADAVWMKFQLIQSDTGLAVPYSQTLALYQLTGQSTQLTVTRTVLVTVAS